MLDTIQSRREFIRAAIAVTVGSLGCEGRSEPADLPATWWRGSDELTATLTESVVDYATLKATAAAKGLLFGSSIKREIGTTDPEYVAVLAAACAYLATEAGFHWQFMCPTRATRDFTRSDWAVQFIKSRHMTIRGGNLLWHHRLPPWFAGLNKQEALLAMKDQLGAVTGRYAGQVIVWDVVNEALDPADGRKEGLRRSPLLDLIGPQYIEEAFRVCASRDASALLVYNEYGFEYETPSSVAKRNALLRLLERLRCAGTPVHALGIQSHLRGEEDRFSERKYRAFLSEVAGMGLKLTVTELDVADRGLPSEIKKRDQIIADVYERYLNVVLDERSVFAVNTWGLSDRHTWLAAERPRKDGLQVRSLPLDSNLQPKPAWFAMARAFAGAPTRSPLQHPRNEFAQPLQRFCAPPAELSTD